MIELFFEERIRHEDVIMEFDTEQDAIDFWDVTFESDKKNVIFHAWIEVDGVITKTLK